LKLFENFARQCPEKDVEEVSVRLRIFSKTAVRFLKLYPTSWPEGWRLSPSVMNESF
jgi:hypothetical protein